MLGSLYLCSYGRPLGRHALVAQCPGQLSSFAIYGFLMIASMMLPGCDRITPLPPKELDSLIVGRSADSGTDTPALSAKRIDRVLASGLNRRILSNDVNAAWQVVHGVICYGKQLQLEVASGKTEGAIDYLFQGGEIRGWKLEPGVLIRQTGKRGLKAVLEPGSYIGQGHVDQWIGYFALAGIPSDETIRVGQESFTVLDMVRQAQLDVSSNPLREYSWTLMALTHYLPEESSWTALDGKTWSWEQLVEEELRYDLHESACGGAHRLVGLVLAVQAKKRMKLPDSLVWQEAEQVIEQCIEAAQTMRNTDGSLSANYFSRPGATRDLSASLASTGHVFEFAVQASSPDQLSSAWLEQAAIKLCGLLEAADSNELDCGALYHALNGLKIYREKRFGRGPS